MFMLTPSDGVLLAAGWLGLTTALLLGVFRLLPRSRRPVPINVPLVPRPATKCVTRPLVWRMISGPVVS